MLSMNVLYIDKIIYILKMMLNDDLKEIVPLIYEKIREFPK